MQDNLVLKWIWKHRVPSSKTGSVNLMLELATDSDSGDRLATANRCLEVSSEGDFNF
jgi:hypothetical protein